MSHKKCNPKEQIDYLSEELIDNIVNTPDNEILKEVKEEYGDSSYVANTMRAEIKRCCKLIDEED